MIQSIINEPLALTSNTSAVVFPIDDIRSRSACQYNCNGWLCHQEGNPQYQITQSGRYEVTFNTDVSSATAGVVSLGLLINGVETPSAIASATIAAPDDYENLKITKVIDVCPRGVTTISIASIPAVPTPTTPATPITTEIPILVHSNLIIKKIS